MLEHLNSIDQQLFLFLNGMHNSFFDFIMYWASNRFVWIPLYVFFLVVLVKTYRKLLPVILILIAAMITASDQISSGLVKNSVQRVRPCHDPEIKSQVHLVNGHCGGTYGFYSSHASNSAALAIFLLIILRAASRKTGTQSVVSMKLLMSLLLGYGLLVSYSRIYLGVHYPGDVITGIIAGSILSFIFAQIFILISSRQAL